MITGYILSGKKTRYVNFTAVSDLSGSIFYHWYRDSIYQGVTNGPVHGFYLSYTTESDIVAVDTNDPDFDPLAAPPATYPSFRTLWWVRGSDTAAVQYLLEYTADGGAWTTFKKVNIDPTFWEFQYRTFILTDDVEYDFAVSGIDIAGNIGSRRTVLSDLMVSRPSAPDFTISFSAGTSRITFAEV